MDIIEFTTIQLSAGQMDFMGWCNAHYEHLLELRKSGCLDVKRGRTVIDFDPEGKIGNIEKIENYKVTRLA